MLFSDRETTIIRLLLDNEDGLTRDDLIKNLQVSKRTVYREVASLDNSLARLQIRLVKQDNRYQLVGEAAQMAELKQQVQQQPQQQVFDVRRRQNALTARLLLTNDVVTMQQLADEFNVSVATIVQDLNAIEPIFKDYRLAISRKKAAGIQAVGKESNRRRVLSGVLNSEINEYEFFEYLEHPKAQAQQLEYSTRYFIQLLDQNLLKISFQAIKGLQAAHFNQLADSQLQQLIIVLTVSAMRIQARQSLVELKHVDQTKLFKDQRLAIELFKQFPEAVRTHVNMLELAFMALQIQGMSFAVPKNIMLENYDLVLSYRVRNLIQEVSNQFNWDFRQDDVLFQDLMAHLSAALKRSYSQIPELNNPILQRIQTEYQNLYDIVAHSLTHVFPDNHFVAGEIAYVVIHFASSYEKKVQKTSLSALVLCANGIGTAKILETRLRRNIPEITHFTVSRVLDLNNLDLSQFDLVFSTIFLPGFPMKYKVISPMLLANEIKEIRDDIAQHYSLAAPVTPPEPDSDKLAQKTQDFQTAYQSMRAANDILENITVQDLTNSADLLTTLTQITTSLDGVLLTDPEEVARLLLQRMEKAPVGIPNTPMALVHTTSDLVKRPFFSIYNLSHVLPITGMDGQPVQLKRVLLMVGPAKMSIVENSLMGKISGSIIENDLNLEIYKTGTQAIVYQLISSLFLDELHMLNRNEVASQ
ncbi:BglG family transcription antiterminator [Loigolactobacillus bifermentans]|jgi:mannitol operon transcriptional antiterminator|uniref:Transcription regulator, mannitol operon n=1 Tax=Loigolactobacillus bifermentans DSM 20003 TaxID=1423726 RepID=A0A0R1GLU2_9LACO|nr:BglG family transcription antiterminator [Loigolactobacillus bifermentans]KRK32660.1 transcription regulator, mannitol operon [Loigolactobacillus bifermentans DSM 20003]QGG60324.1 PRD domain-containing protein [Loigolactobacillus bifermentans]